MSTMGERIKESREKKGLLQSQLAEMISVKSGAVISNWEKDINKPDADKLVRLCQALGVSLSYLLDYYGKKAPATQELSDAALAIAICFDKTDAAGQALLQSAADYINHVAMQASARATLQENPAAREHFLSQPDLRSNTQESSGKQNG